MSVAAADSYARRRLLDLLGIERYVRRERVHEASSRAATPDGVPVGGAEAPMLFASSPRRAVRASAAPTGHAVAISCEPGATQRYPKLVAHLARAIGVDVATFASRIDAPHTLCFGASPPDGPATLAPPLATLRSSPAAKRAFWRTLRDLRRIVAGR